MIKNILVTSDVELDADLELVIVGVVAVSILQYVGCCILVGKAKSGIPIEWEPSKIHVSNHSRSYYYDGLVINAEGLCIG